MILKLKTKIKSKNIEIIEKSSILNKISVESVWLTIIRVEIILLYI